MNIGGFRPLGACLDEFPETPAVPADEAEITLGMLTAVGENSAHTQRSMASELGIALGLANAYLKRCARKGLIKVQQIPANRYAYYLTPKGFAEKSRLTAEFLTQSFNFFRESRDQCSEVLRQCAARGWRRIALAGVSDLSDIATLCATDGAVELVGIVDPSRNETTYAGLPVVASLKMLGGVDAVVITDLKAPQAAFDRLIQVFPQDRVLAPALLKISRHRPILVE